MSESEKQVMIESLTQEQIDKQPEYVDKWVKIGLCTDPADFEGVIQHIKDAYTVADETPPQFFIGPVNSPYDAAIVEGILHKFVQDEVEFDSSEHLNELVMDQLKVILSADKLEDVKHLFSAENVSISNQIYGCSEYWLSYYDYFQTECGLDLHKINPLVEIAKRSGWWTPLKNVAIIQHRPEEIHRDEENRLHNTEGAAVKFRGDHTNANVYAVHGVRVTKKIIDRDFTAKDIQDEENEEVRRVMIDLYGDENFIVDIGATEIASDDFGTLYKQELENDEPIMMVKVVNSTPEPDGSYKDYYIRVDPNAYGGLEKHATPARAAIASTWRHKDGSMVFPTPEDYDCLIET